MARIRSIKPEFWTDEKVVMLTSTAKCLFIGLWNFCDDEGRMEFSPLRIKLQVLPLDSSDLSAELGELRRNGLTTVYEVNGKQYLQVNNFSKHQKVDKRTPSKIPPPPPVSPESPRITPTPPDGREGNGVEGKEEKTTNVVQKKGTRLSVESLPDGWREFCKRERPDLNPEQVFDEFRDYWIGIPGSRGVKLDWSATWRNRVRDCRRPPPKQHAITPMPSAAGG